MGGRRRLRRHRLREGRRRDEYGRHRARDDQPAGGPQRLPPDDRHRDDPGHRRRPRRPVDRRVRADGRWRQGVLLRWRPADPRRPRLPRDGGRPGDRDAAAQRARLPDAHPQDAQAGDRGRQRVGRRRRARAPRRLRPDDRERQRAVYADRPEGRELRRRLRDGPPRPDRRAEKGPRDLVPLPALRRATGARHGARQHGRAARRAGARDGPVVPRDPRQLEHRHPHDQGRRQRRRGRRCRAFRSWRATRPCCST